MAWAFLGNKARNVEGGTVARFELNDNEISFIALVMQKIDPTGIMADAQSIVNKIRAYAQEKQNEQAAAAAEVEGV